MSRNYRSPNEFNKRFNIFADNYHRIQEFNEKESESNGIVLKINKFADLNEKEFEKLLGYNPKHLDIK
jgi:hypothetical protein